MPSSKVFLALSQEEKRAVWRKQQASWRERHPWKEQYANDPIFREKTRQSSKNWNRLHPEVKKAQSKRYRAKVFECWQMFKEEYYKRKKFIQSNTSVSTYA